MPLPSPLPDDPRKWDGWRNYISPDPYERLGLSLEDNPSDARIEDHCRQFLVWWQKKLPLKNQPGNPMTQLLGAGIDTAPGRLTAARAELLNPESRARIDGEIRERRRSVALAEFNRFLDFALADKILTSTEETSLLQLGASHGLASDDMLNVIAEALQRTGSQRKEDAPESASAPSPPPLSPPPTPAELRRVRATSRVNLGRQSPEDDFRRMLRLSGLDAETITDDQRDAFINMAENLGLDPGAAEDLVDEYLEGMDGTGSGSQSASAAPLARPVPYVPQRPTGTAPPSARPAAVGFQTPVRPAAAASTSAPSRAPGGATAPVPATAPAGPKLTPDQERAKFPNFRTAIGQQMLLIPTASFAMGSVAPGAAANEAPVMRVTVGRFYMARHPVTNAQYEQFDPAHRARRLSTAGDLHPAVFVSWNEAQKFCEWLSRRERRRFRLPTEAEWELAARGIDGRTYPWGEAVGRPDLANFADANTSFGWSDKNINDGWAETSPIGSFPRGGSPFGLEDAAGNVWEWCADFYELYKSGEHTNPTGPKAGSQRVCRGGSWKSRFTNLRATTRGFNAPLFSANDVGFRVACDCEGG